MGKRPLMNYGLVSECQLVFGTVLRKPRSTSPCGTIDEARRKTYDEIYSEVNDNDVHCVQGAGERMAPVILFETNRRSLSRRMHFCCKL